MNRLASPVAQRLALTAAMAATLALCACGRADEDGRTVGQQVDSAIASTERTAEHARQEAREAMSDIRQVTAETGNKVADAAITASVNADLAKDSDLSALGINVDTVDGHVTLKGSAPTAQARERATRLAGNVKGVTAVDNRLNVQR